MKLLVYMRDGRTCYRIVGRKNFARVEQGIWNPATGEYIWSRVKIRHIAKASISAVEEDVYTQVATA